MRSRAKEDFKKVFYLLLEKNTVDKISATDIFKATGNYTFKSGSVNLDEDFFRYSETQRFLRYLLYWDIKSYECSVEFMAQQIQLMNDIDCGNNLNEKLIFG